MSVEVLAQATVGDLSPRPHARVAVDAPMWKVVEEMSGKRRGAVLVEDGGKLVGIFTERDLVSRIDHGDMLWSHVLVRDVMTPHPMVVRSDDSLNEALRRLIQGHRRHLPVVDDRGLRGLISIGDLTRWIVRDREQTIEDLYEYLRRA